MDVVVKRKYVPRIEPQLFSTQTQKDMAADWISCMRLSEQIPIFI
jgi:hypothetical protein